MENGIDYPEKWMQCGHYKTFLEFMKLAQAQQYFISENSIEVPKKLKAEYERLTKFVSFIHFGQAIKIYQPYCTGLLFIFLEC